MPNSPTANTAPARTVPDSATDLVSLANEFDDIEVDADGKCHWTAVVNAQTHLRAQLRIVARIMDLAALLDAAEFDGLAIDKQPTGYTASIVTGTSDWSPREFASSASEAVAKCLKKHAPVRTVLAPPPY